MSDPVQDGYEDANILERDFTCDSSVVRGARNRIFLLVTVDRIRALCAEVERLRANHDAVAAELQREIQANHDQHRDRLRLMEERDRLRADLGVVRAGAEYQSTRADIAERELAEARALIRRWAIAYDAPTNEHGVVPDWYPAQDALYAYAAAHPEEK